ncbi:thiamine phosphate synthase [Thermostilla marina]
MTTIDREFTPAAKRAVMIASQWVSATYPAGITPEAVLLGLLAEPECRAAMILTSLGIDEASVRRRWPDLAPARTATDASQCACSPQLVESFLAIDSEIDWGDWPRILSTEHLLFGLAVADHDVGQWLRDRGLKPTVILDTVMKRYGVSRAPLDFDDDSGRDRDIAEPSGTRLQKTAPVSKPPTKDSKTPESSDTNDRVEPRSPPVLSGGTTDREAPFVSPDRTLISESAHETAGIYRLIDASINRCIEGVRVIEDYVRFVLDDRHLTERLKSWRHDFVSAASRFAPEQRLAFRDTSGDVGTTLSLATERERGSIDAVLAANFSRTAEALRSLEEWSKVLLPEVSAAFEALRYRSYSLQQAVCNTRRAVRRLVQARLYVLIDAGTSDEDLRRLVRALRNGGADIVQLREKRLDDRELFRRGRIVREELPPGGPLFIMNDRPDLAVAVEADGVHVGQEELPVREARKIVGADRLVGVSTHNIEQARQAVLDGANYIGVGPTFPSTTKRFAEFPGLAFVAQVAREIRLPAFAIGGITFDNIGEVLNAGLGRVAVSGAVTQADDPETAVRRLKAALLE